MRCQRSKTMYAGSVNLAGAQGKVSKLALPDDVVFVEEMPHTATGKVSKLTLRQRFKDYKLSKEE